MCESCSSYMPKKWMREGEKQYKSGLTKSELRDYENGQRVSGRIGAPHSQTKKELTEKGINVAKLVNERSHRNIIKGLRLTQEKLTSGKALRMRDVAGYSEAITGGARERITEHAHVTKGALLELQSIPTQWKYHSSDSKEYTKALNALKDYHMALARNDGGKASEFQTRLCKAAYDYLKDKRSTRSHPNGRKRFNAFMTLLYEELKPSEFQKVVDKVNQKRKDGEKICVEEFEAKKNRFMKASRKDEKAFLDSSGENATRLDLRTAATVMEMDDLYKPEQYNNPREPEKSTIYSPVGLPIQAGHKGGSLSMKDFAAVSFASALSSRQRDKLLIENNILVQSEEAAAEGKKVSDAAFKAYGEGDKVPLAKLLTIGIRKLNEESAGRTGSEKACMKEMSQRIFNMLQRDPELQKYAERQGLTKEDMKAAGKTAEELKKEPEVRNIIHEEGLIL